MWFIDIIVYWTGLGVSYIQLAVEPYYWKTINGSTTHTHTHTHTAQFSPLISTRILKLKVGNISDISACVCELAANKQCNDRYLNKLN